MNRPYRLHRAVETVTEGARRRIAEATLSLFQYAPYPLENTLEYRGDPGLMGPGSI